MKRPPSPLELRPPQHSNQRDVYRDAMKMLVKPYPSYRVRDWHFFNKFVGGLRLYEYSILCGQTGAGKTQWLANLSKQLIQIDLKHAVFSVETGRLDYMNRIISAFAAQDVNTGDAIPKSKLHEIHLKYGHLLDRDTIEYSHYESRVPVEQLMSEIKYYVEKLACKVVIIDNLNFFMEVTRAADSILEMDRVTHNLVEFVKQVPVHILMVMHPRKTDGEGRVQSEYDIKGSSTAVQEAHNVLLFNRPMAAHIKNGVREWSDRELTFTKMRRRGMYAGSTVVLGYNNGMYDEKGGV